MYYHGNWIRGPDDSAGLQDGFGKAFRHACPSHAFPLMLVAHCMACHLSALLPPSALHVMSTESLVVGNAPEAYTRMS